MGRVYSGQYLSLCTIPHELQSRVHIVHILPGRLLSVCLPFIHYIIFISISPVSEIGFLRNIGDISDLHNETFSICKLRGFTVWKIAK
jgi:hypothetical protein